MVTFNPPKTNAVLITLRNFDHMPLLRFESTNLLQFVESHKHLGLTLSRDDKWTDHIHKVKISAAKVLGIMRKLKLSVSRNTHNQIYSLIYRLSWSMSLSDGP